LTERTGFQIAANDTEATVHADAVVGDTLDTPATASATLVEDVAIDSPTTASATQIDAPADSAAAALSGNQITDAGSLYVADSSVNINTYIYAYKIIGGIKYYVGTAATFNFTDNNDANNFYIQYAWSDLGVDGYVIVSSGSSGAGNPNWTKDVGNVGTFSDDGSLSATDTIPTDFSTVAFPHFITSLTGANTTSPTFQYSG
jgi:hypothetical protein